MEHGPLIGDVLMKTSVHKGFFIAMFDYQRAIMIIYRYIQLLKIAKASEQLQRSMQCKSIFSLWIVPRGLRSDQSFLCKMKMPQLQSSDAYRMSCSQIPSKFC